MFARVVAVVLGMAGVCAAEAGEWAQPRHDGGLTSVQPMAGGMRQSPRVLAEGKVVVLWLRGGREIWRLAFGR